MAKRGNNEGTIYKRKDGRWTAAVSLENGSRRYLYGKTRQEVARKLTVALRDKDLGVPATPERQTLGGHLEHWLDVTEPTIRYSTFKRYEEYVRLHVIPVLGKIRISRLTPQHIQELYALKLSEGLSPTTVNHLHAVLYRALGQALRWGLIARNVTDAVDPPRKSHTEMQTLNPEQAKQLLDSARDDRLEALYVLALTTGMRQGEMLALHWRDVDLNELVLQVRWTLERNRVLGEPKTKKARRQITLTPLAAEALRRHKVRQYEERLAAGRDWIDLDLVFTNQVGSYVDADNLRHRSFPRLLEEAGLPAMRFHDLRHSAATLLLSLGTHPKIVQEILGHSQISVTMDTYSHILPGLQEEAAAKLNALLKV